MLLFIILLLLLFDILIFIFEFLINELFKRFSSFLLFLFLSVFGKLLLPEFSLIVELNTFEIKFWFLIFNELFNFSFLEIFFLLSILSIILGLTSLINISLSKLLFFIFFLEFELFESLDKEICFLIIFFNFDLVVLKVELLVFVSIFFVSIPGKILLFLFEFELSINCFLIFFLGDLFKDKDKSFWLKNKTLFLISLIFFECLSELGLKLFKVLSLKLLFSIFGRIFCFFVLFKSNEAFDELKLCSLKKLTSFEFKCFLLFVL